MDSGWGLVGKPPWTFFEDESRAMPSPSAAAMPVPPGFPSGFDPDAEASGDGIFGLPTPPEDAALVLLPVPWDVTTSYRRGTARGPSAIRAASAQVDLFDLETGRPWERGIAMLDEDALLVAWHAAAEGARDAGDKGRVNELCARMNARVHEQTRRLRGEGRIVGVVGGDHSVPFGAIRALAEEFPGLGVLHVDAHADLREAYQGYAWSHASIFWNVLAHVPQVARVVQVGIRDLGEREHLMIEAEHARPDGRLRTFFDKDLKDLHWRTLIDQLPGRVWVSFDVDGLDPALCPNTGTPVPGGLSFREACALLRTLGESGRRIVGFDLNEVSPEQTAVAAPGGSRGDGAEPKDSWDAIVGARLLYKLCGWTLRSNP
jgi:agmatinase